MIPGPISFEPKVLRKLTVQNIGHLSAEFVEAFKGVLEGLREVVGADHSYQPLVLAGSGTLAMEAAVSNFLVEGSKVLVVSSGVFGRRYADLLSKYPVEVEVVESEPGGIVEPEAVAERLERDEYDVVTVTHVDTSTSVRYPIERLGRIVTGKNTLLVVDGVCSVGGEEVRMKDWNVDVLLTGSQKALGVPPGLAILWLSPKAMERLEETKAKCSPYYMDFTLWIPIMRSYEEGKPRYFATPPVNLIMALHESLKLILEEGVDNVVARHKALAEALREGVKALGLKLMVKDERYAASTVTGIVLPGNVEAKEFISEVKMRNVIVAGGLIQGINYFRVGHMGPVNGNDIVATVAAIERALLSLGVQVDVGAGVGRVQRTLLKYKM